MSLNLVTVIIPIHNASMYLKKCIDSVLGQTWPHIEIILINDGSSDDSLAIAKSYESENVKVFSQEKSGAAKARNKGLTESKGAFIQFLDADDFISPDKIEIQVTAAIQNPEKIMVCSTIHFTDENLHSKLLPSVYEDRFIESEDDPTRFLTRLWGGFDNQGSMVQPNAWLVPKQIIDNAGFWDETLTLDDDGEFFSRVILHSKGICKTKGYNYYRKSLTAKNLSAGRSLSSYRSLLDAVISKKNELLSRTDSPDAAFAIYRLLYDVAVLSYPKYLEISNEAIASLPKINRKFQVNVGGGRLVKGISRLIGWRATKKLIEFKTKFK